MRTNTQRRAFSKIKPKDISVRGCNSWIMPSAFPERKQMKANKCCYARGLQACLSPSSIKTCYSWLSAAMLQHVLQYVQMLLNGKAKPCPDVAAILQAHSLCRSCQSSLSYPSQGQSKWALNVSLLQFHGCSLSYIFSSSPHLEFCLTPLVWPSCFSRYYDLTIGWLGLISQLGRILNHLADKPLDRSVRGLFRLH